MAIQLNDNTQVLAGKHQDEWWGPYESTAAACAAIPVDYRFIGRIVGILIGNHVTEYWWNNGTADANLVPYGVYYSPNARIRVPTYADMKAQFTTDQSITQFFDVDSDEKNGGGDPGMYAYRWSSKLKKFKLTIFLALDAKL